MENDKKKDDVKVKVQLFENGELLDEKEGTGLVGALVTECDCGCGKESAYAIAKGMLSSEDLIVGSYKISKVVDDIIRDKEEKKALKAALKETLGDLPSPEEFMKRINP